MKRNNKIKNYNSNKGIQFHFQRTLTSNPNLIRGNGAVEDFDVFMKAV